MDDARIIELFYERSEQAIKETNEKYGSTIRRIAYNILGNIRDTEECESDTYLAAWNKIPPERPDPLAAYMYRIARNLAVKRYRENTATKRNSNYDLALDELDELIPGKTDNPASEYEIQELKKAIETFLRSLEKEDRYLFMYRYWYLSSVSDIAKQINWKPHRVTVRLSRIRSRLQKYLQKEGIMP